MQLEAAIQADYARGRTIPCDGARVAATVTRYCLENSTITLSASDALAICYLIWQRQSAAEDDVVRLHKLATDRFEALLDIKQTTQGWLDKTTR